MPHGPVVCLKCKAYMRRDSNGRFEFECKKCGARIWIFVEELERWKKGGEEK